MASGGDRTPEYCCVLKNMTCIIDHLKTNEDAKERLIQKLQQKRWIDIPCKSKEHELVRTALNRIKDDANEYYAFIDMLQNITGMDVVVKKMNGMQILRRVWMYVVHSILRILHTMHH